jgi:hypothetical protein
VGDFHLELLVDDFHLACLPILELLDRQVLAARKRIVGVGGVTGRARIESRISVLQNVCILPNCRTVRGGGGGGHREGLRRAWH